MYKIFTSQLNNIQFIFRTTDNTFIPIDEGNISYQEYLKWISEGNVAEEYNPEEV
jgi:hypothetical protein